MRGERASEERVKVAAKKFTSAQLLLCNKQGHSRISCCSVTEQMFSPSITTCAQLAFQSKTLGLETQGMVGSPLTPWHSEVFLPLITKVVSVEQLLLYTTSETDTG